MTIENAAINQAQINATVGEEIKLELKTKTLRNIKVTQEYNEKEEADSAIISKQTNNPVIADNPQQQLMKEKILLNQLESEVENSLNSEEFMSEEEYKVLSTKILSNDLNSFNKINKNKKVEFLIKTYKDTCADLNSFNKINKNKKVEFLIKTYKDTCAYSEKVLDAVLPYVDALTIKTSLKFYAPENLSNAKKISLLSRLAPDAKPLADETLISLLLVSDENVIAGCSLNTLMALRNKEYLGTKFYEELSKQSSGKLTKAQHKELAKLSAKITTICYAYYIETTMEAITASINNKTSITEKDLKLKGVKDDVKAKLIAKLKAEGMLDKDNKGMAGIDQAKLKESIKNIVGDTLKMKEELAQKQKIAKMQQNISDIIGDTMKLKAEFEKNKTNTN